MPEAVRRRLNVMLNEKQELFSVEELSLMESLEVKGGASEMAASQVGCSNNVAGCGCDVIIVQNPSQSGQQHA
ncbi:hypothetical protein [Prevotella jejuni]|uniref:hypothetical protein n=1 Tax=Prevotella jejuni TaxID=1177574 RepID=UPI002150F7A9|nr:hypothetical protein [Prevotella jejuni]